MLKDWNHSSLTVTDVDRSAEFYGQAFGFVHKFTVRDMTHQIASITGVEGARCDLMQLDAPVGDHVLELIAFHHPPRDETDDRPRPLQPGQAHVSFVVEDLDATLVRIEKLGARRLGAVTEFAEGRAAYCQEPGGSVLELEELYEQEDSADGE